MTSPRGDHLEIERVFLLDRLPRLPECAQVSEIVQGYFRPEPSALRDPGAANEGRIRRRIAQDGTETFTRTIKRGAGMVRMENEESIEPEEFDRLWPATAGRRIRKTRYRVQEAKDAALIWEIDEFHDLDVVLAEVEIPSADYPLRLPPWLEPHVVREVTDEPAFRNYELAVRAGASR